MVLLYWWGWFIYGGWGAHPSSSSRPAGMARGQGAEPCRGGLCSDLVRALPQNISAPPAPPYPGKSKMHAWAGSSYPAGFPKLSALATFTDQGLSLHRALNTESSARCQPKVTFHQPEALTTSQPSQIPGRTLGNNMV